MRFASIHMEKCHCYPTAWPENTVNRNGGKRLSLARLMDVSWTFRGGKSSSLEEKHILDAFNIMLGSRLKTSTCSSGFNLSEGFSNGKSAPLIPVPTESAVGKTELWEHLALGPSYGLKVWPRHKDLHFTATCQWNEKHSTYRPDQFSIYRRSSAMYKRDGIFANHCPVIQRAASS